ncbi:MAG: hypothetical protein QNJ46_03445 [Leptolyngbyaceae cyanobacterium MO_188.B28]|nr:hypothetical protein [Leptolyngbyaceae cyanobacterium MO_188.B28]
MAIALLGDRIIIQSVAFEVGLIKVNIITQGPDDPQCCPTQATIQTYELQDQQLKLISEKVVDRDNE